MSPDEAAILCGAVEDASCWGAGAMVVAQQRIEAAGYQWTVAHEQFIDELFD